MLPYPCADCRLTDGSEKCCFYWPYDNAQVRVSTATHGSHAPRQLKMLGHRVSIGSQLQNLYDGCEMRNLLVESK